MLTLDEAINHCHEKSKELSEQLDFIVDDEIEKSCVACMMEHEQLAEWLKDYKRLLALEDKIKSIVFSDSPDIAILKIRDMFTGENEE